MSAATAVTLSEYLNTSYRPDCDYLEGELLERNVGEWDHARLQMLLSGFFLGREKDLGILVVPEQRVQVKAQRFRVPDITVLAGPRPAGGIITEPPLLCIEILSPSDRIVEMQDRIHDYLDFGVRYVWLIDPRTRLTYVHTPDGVQEVKDGVLTTKDPDIRLVLSELE
ncbi:MAG: Uma2 family endonuclease [Acidobacteriota bacterium]|nr:Uma2 family endonuclease [Acidobacteriota bacterium]